MKGYQINGFGLEQLTRVEMPIPDPGPTDVLVRIHSASLNYRDLMIVEGRYDPRLKFPTVPLSDGAGEVVAVGENVTKWKPGDRVTPIFAARWIDGPLTPDKRRTGLSSGPEWPGVLREYGCFDEASLVAIPQHLSFQEAATLPCAAVTAWNAVVAAGRAKPGDTVLTLGTGGVSIFALQFAKLGGARVIITSSSDEKLERARALGADETVNYADVPEWDREVLRLTGKRGVDNVVEVGGSGTLSRSVNAVRMGGHVALIGVLSNGSFDPVNVLMKGVTVKGIFVGSRRLFEDMNRAIELAKLRPVIDRTFDFENAREAFNYLKEGSHFGKIVISIKDQ